MDKVRKDSQWKPSEKLSKQVQIRVTKSEYEKLKNMKEKLGFTSFSELVRQFIQICTKDER